MTSDPRFASARHVPGDVEHGSGVGEGALRFESSLSHLLAQLLEFKFWLSLRDLGPIPPPSLRLFLQLRSEHSHLRQSTQAFSTVPGTEYSTCSIKTNDFYFDC